MAAAVQYSDYYVNVSRQCQIYQEDVTTFQGIRYLSPNRSAQPHNDHLPLPASNPGPCGDTLVPPPPSGNDSEVSLRVVSVGLAIGQTTGHPLFKELVFYPSAPWAEQGPLSRPP